MNPALALPIQSVGRLLLRSVAVNFSLVGAVVAGFVATHSIAGFVTPSQRKRAFLRVLTNETRGVSNDTLLSYLDSQDPIEKAKAALGDRDTDLELSAALRKALAETL